MKTDARLRSAPDQPREAVTPRPMSRQEEVRAAIIAAQASRQAADELINGPIGSAQRKARSKLAAMAPGGAWNQKRSRPR